MKNLSVFLLSLLLTLTVSAYAQFNYSSIAGPVIAFASNQDAGVFQVFIMKANGTKQSQLTNAPAYNARPNWSHDGRKITFTTCRPPDCEIYVMNADGSGQTDVSNNPATEQMSVWSPDDSKIAFVSNRDGLNQILRHECGRFQSNASE